MSTLTSRLVLCAVLTSSAVLLSACASSTAPSPSRTASATSTPTGKALSGSAGGIDCNNLQPDLQPALSALNANLALQNAPSPQVGTYPATILDAGGVFCEWSAPGGASVSVALVKLGSKDLATEQAKVAASSTPSTLIPDAPDVSVYTANSGGSASGDIETFTKGGYWVSTISPMFDDPSAAKALLQSILQALPSG